MKNHFGISIPTKPYLAKYLQALYGSPIVFSTGNYFGTSLLGYLNSRLYLQTESVTFQKFNTFDFQLKVYLPKYWITQYKFKTQLSPCNTIYLNKHFEEKFEEDLYRYCNFKVFTGLERKLALEQFCAEHTIEIDVDITYEALKQKEYRHRKNLEKKLYKSVPLQKCA